MSPGRSGFKLARIGDLREFENGTYRPHLQPHFRSLRYSIRERSGGEGASGAIPEIRGANSIGEFDVACIANRPAATIAVTNVNEAPTGTVSFTAENGVLLAANTLADPEGPGTIGYQWQSSANGTSWTDIARQQRRPDRRRGPGYAAWRCRQRHLPLPQPRRGP